jgi:hypothetical protein
VGIARAVKKQAGFVWCGEGLSARGPRSRHHRLILVNILLGQSGARPRLSPPQAIPSFPRSQHSHSSPTVPTSATRGGRGSESSHHPLLCVWGPGGSQLRFGGGDAPLSSQTRMRAPIRGARRHGHHQIILLRPWGGAYAGPEQGRTKNQGSARGRMLCPLPPWLILPCPS